MPGSGETARLRLRTIRLGDAGHVSALMTPAVSRWLISWALPFTPAMATDRIAQARARLADGSMLPFAIERLSDSAFLGWLSITRQDARRALLSYWLGEAYQGQGYMREALAAAALPDAFRLLDVDVIEAEVQADNAASLALLRGLGMVTLGARVTFAPSRGRDEPCVALALRREVEDRRREPDQEAARK